ncbi:MAG: LysR family transcriptional regulator [Lachnospiraceae bacterium]|nr:LysR family transcriptional regulator [Lachnospiraceae bacterium]
MFRYKEYICAVAEFRSISKAAQALNTSQPWLSTKVREVEKLLGVPLFDRSTSPLGLTEAGDFYVAQAKKVMEIEEESRGRLEQFRREQAETINIGSSMFFSGYLLPYLLQDFRKVHPDLILNFSEIEPGTLTDKLLHGELDLALAVEKPEHQGIVTRPWKKEEIVLAVPARYQINRELAEYAYDFDAFLKRGEPGCRKKPVPLIRFLNMPFLLLNERNDIHARTKKICADAGFSPKVKLVLTQMMTAYYLVCEGQGVTLLRDAIPEYVAPNDNVVFYQLDDENAFRSIYLSYPQKKLPAIHRELIDYLDSRGGGILS